MKRAIVLASVFCLVAFSAGAADMGDTYIYGGAGYVSSSMEHPNLAGGTESVSGWIYSLGGGYAFQQNMALGGRFMRFPYSYSDSLAGIKISADLIVTMYMGTFTLFVPVASGSEIAVTAAMGMQGADNSVKVAGETVYTDDDSDSCWMLSAAYLHPLADNLDLVLEGGYYATGAEDLEGSSINALIFGAGIKFDISG